MDCTDYKVFSYRLIRRIIRNKIHRRHANASSLNPEESDDVVSLSTMSLADYLAKNYLTADLKPNKKTKKRKRKDDPQAGLVIADDDALGWNPAGDGHRDDETPVTGKSIFHFILACRPPSPSSFEIFFPVSGSSAEFRKSKANNWHVIGAPAPSSSDQAAADAIITAAAAEATARNLADNDAAVVEPAMMESGAHAGLQTADQITAQLAHRQAEERRRFQRDGDAHSGRGAETIYRDASGRVINVAMARAEARAKAEEEAAKKAAALEAQRGDVQRAEREQRREQLADAKYLPVARFVDDEALNEELKEQQRWDDPARAFLRQKSKGKSISGKPLYAGATMPNRYGIRPGHRWDGVDRGNGFEKEYIMAANRRKDLKQLDYAWQMDE